MATTIYIATKRAGLQESVLGGGSLGVVPEGTMLLVIEWGKGLDDGKLRALIRVQSDFLPQGWVDSDSLGVLDGKSRRAMLSGEWGDPWKLGWKYRPPERSWQPKVQSTEYELEELSVSQGGGGAISPAPARKLGVSANVLAKKLRRKLQEKAAARADESLPAIYTSSELHALAEQYAAQRRAAEVAVKSGGVLRERVGEALVRSHAKVKDMVKEWARGGSGEISKMDFRKHVRKVVDEPDVRLIDDLFNELDSDGGGTLDVGELTAAMKRFQAAAVANEGIKQEARERFELAALRAQTAAEIAARTSEAEMIDAQLTEIVREQGAASRLGHAVFKRTIKASIAEVLDTWETDGHGEVSHAQFVSNVRDRLGGFVGEDAELRALFDTLDKDRGGTLSILELEQGLGKLRNGAREEEMALVRLRSQSSALWSQVKKAQANFAGLRASDSVAAQALREANEARQVRDQLEAQEGAAVRSVAARRAWATAAEGTLKSAGKKPKKK